MNILKAPLFPCKILIETRNWFKGSCSFLRLSELFITIVVITKTKFLIMVEVKVKKYSKHLQSVKKLLSEKNSF